MRRSLALAAAAAADGETAVGAVVVRGDAVIGEGAESTRRLLDPAAHAEILALRAACQHERTLRLAGCELYTTVEPCVLCSYAIRHTGITRVVYGVPAGTAGGATSRYTILSDPDLLPGQPPEIVSGVLAQECLAILQRPRRPQVAAPAAGQCISTSHVPIPPRK
jgi:tRNA(adenine34) deaminase